jgi:DNA-binding transcriptional ArsR family regulator
VVRHAGERRARLSEKAFSFRAQHHDGAGGKSRTTDLHCDVWIRYEVAEPIGAGDIAEHCGVSQQAVSHHLQVLKEVGLVSVRKDGQRQLYVVNPDGFDSVQSFVTELWPSALEGLKTAIEDPKR